MTRLALLTSLLFGMHIINPSLSAQSPNILVVIADDLGVDYSRGYHESSLLPTTPTLDALRADGITFDNVFATPKCTPTRAAVISGKYGVKTGVIGTPGQLETTHTSIFKAIENQTNGLYSDAVIGKWHISSPPDPQHPTDHGVDYYTGLLSAMVDDYYAWERTENGQTSLETTYVTTALTDAAIDWVNAQENPWFLWLAHVAPHSPYHTPPDSLYTISNTNNNRRKYVAMIEGMDHELGRLLDNIPSEELDNTIIIYFGDNGTPNGVLQDYPNGQGKSTIYQGGIRVPLIVAGAGVTRQGEREPALVHVTDIYATLLELVGADLPGGIYNSLSFLHLLNDTPGPTRDYNYSEQEESGISGFAIRNDRYKLIEYVTTGTQELYDLLLDSLETNNLLEGGINADLEMIKSDLEAEAAQIRTAWSCRDHIRNGDEAGIDCGGTYCSPCISAATTLASAAVSLSPNPATDQLFMTFPTGRYRLEVWHTNGILCRKVPVSGSQYHLDVQDLTSGMYVLKLIDLTADGFYVKKWVKQ